MISLIGSYADHMRESESELTAARRRSRSPTPRFLLALEFKQIIEPDSNILMVGGRAINADTAADSDGQPPWIDLPAARARRRPFGCQSGFLGVVGFLRA